MIHWLTRCGAGACQILSLGSRHCSYLIESPVSNMCGLPHYIVIQHLSAHLLHFGDESIFLVLAGRGKHFLKISWKWEASFSIYPRRLRCVSFSPSRAGAGAEQPLRQRWWTAGGRAGPHAAARVWRWWQPRRGSVERAAIASYAPLRRRTPPPPSTTATAAVRYRRSPASANLAGPRLLYSLSNCFALRPLVNKFM